jgi:hypothetical protein
MANILKKVYELQFYKKKFKFVLPDNSKDCADLAIEKLMLIFVS